MKTPVQKSKLIIAIALLSIIAISCGNKEKEQATGSQEKVAAETAVAKLADYPVVHSFSGKLEADKQSNLSTRIMGQIQRIYVKPGQKVNQGDLLIQIK
jgi:multidrug efflux pump subunit AcrA (membrane-fusion protein)